MIGFENHSGRTYLGKGVAPLGKMVSGYGNNGRDGTEGVHYKKHILHLFSRPGAAQEPGFGRQAD